MQALINNVTDASWENDVLKSETPVLVDFWAPWCEPCKALIAVLEALASAEMEGCKIVKANVDDCFAIASKYGVRGIPTLMLFVGGVCVGTKVGQMSKFHVETFIKNNV